MQLIEHAWSKWSVRASAILTATWASVAGAWVLIDPATQAAILADLGIGPMTMAKVLGYLALLSAASTGLIGALRVIQQPPAKDAP